MSKIKKEPTVYEKNKVIAIFDGWEIKITDLVNYPKGYHQFQIKKGINIQEFYCEESSVGNHFKYNISWDWLMPVGKKIYDILQAEQKLRPRHTASEGDLIEVDIHCAIREYDILKAHEYIYRFCLWYKNKNKQKK